MLRSHAGACTSTLLIGYVDIHMLFSGEYFSQTVKTLCIQSGLEIYDKTSTPHEGLSCMKIKSDYKLQTSTLRQSTAAVQTVLLSTENGACDGVNINS
jgi:hypothetical protein